ncbi:hypothetical protein DV515_00013571 [Chloebia gouldiae]|uniref:Uncharacterized protein n=1 Tax=Chloebia gouldiae TaxID=44316 RepID=A0A3L8S0P7_CHLGU|nr:hypothetical protein DV515_00013571 [Chloebia gouldiae]
MGPGPDPHTGATPAPCYPAGSGPDSHTWQSSAAVQEDLRTQRMEVTMAEEWDTAVQDTYSHSILSFPGSGSRKLLHQRIRSLPQWQLVASPVLKDISQLQDGFVRKKLQSLGQRSRLPNSHGAARRDLFAKSPCGTPEPVREAGTLQRSYR